MAKLYGVGVGPGDSELLTLKALRLIKESPVICVPRSGQKINVALTIASGAYPEIFEKEILELDMPMVRDMNSWRAKHLDAAKKVEEILEDGRNVVFLTLGDPTVYSTYCYVHNIILEHGYEAEIVPGVPSFCAVAARLNIGLTEASESLHIIPASYDCLEETMKLEGTKVLMKSGKLIGSVRDYVLDNHADKEVSMVERCGLEGERVFRNIEEVPDDASYFSVIVVKDKKEEE